jgi:hypothetical protein
MFKGTVGSFVMVIFKRRDLVGFLVSLRFFNKLLPFLSISFFQTVLGIFLITISLDVTVAAAVGVMLWIARLIPIVQVMLLAKVHTNRPRQHILVFDAVPYRLTLRLCWSLNSARKWRNSQICTGPQQPWCVCAFKFSNSTGD